VANPLSMLAEAERYVGQTPYLFIEDVVYGTHSQKYFIYIFFERYVGQTPYLSSSKTSFTAHILKSTLFCDFLYTKRTRTLI
jgi:hypothetical protein